MKNYAYEAKERYNGSFFSISSRGAKAPHYDGPSITFTEEDANGVHFFQNDAFIVDAMIDNYTICRVLIDDGSSVDILYSYCLEKMGIDKSQLTTTSQSLYGFTGHSIIPKGSIKLSVTVGEKPNTLTVMSNFLVVKGNSQFNAVLGRPTLRTLKAISSIYHQVVKFPTPSGVGL